MSSKIIHKYYVTLAVNTHDKQLNMYVKQQIRINDICVSAGFNIVHIRPDKRTKKISLGE